MLTPVQANRRLPLPPDYLVQLGAALYRGCKNAQSRLLAMLEAYFDESHGTPESAYAVAGFVAPAEVWTAFDVAWRRVMEQEDLEFFHMSEFESRHGPYRDWSNDRRHRVLGQLIDIMVQHPILGIGSGILRTEFKDAISQLPARHPYRNPYLISLQACLERIPEAVQQGALPDEPVSLFVELNPRQQAPKHFDRLRRVFSWHERFPSLVFHDKHLAPLQAADLYAYECYKQIQRERDGHGGPSRWPLRMLGKASQSRFISRVRFMDTAGLSRMLAHVVERLEHFNATQAGRNGRV